MSDNPNVILRDSSGVELDVALETTLLTRAADSTLTSVGSSIVSALNDILTVTGPILKQEVDIQATVIYVGTAPLSTATSAASWRIKRVLITGGGAGYETEWTGTTAIWDNRATESYT